MNDTTYLIHLDGRLLTEGRERNQDAFKYQDPAPARVLLQEWINKTAFHWTGIDLTLRYSGPVPDLGNPQKRFFATRATLAAELAVSTRLHFLQNADNSAFAASSEYNYLSRFDDTVNELLSLLEIMVNRLRQRVSELDVPETEQALLQRRYSRRRTERAPGESHLRQTPLRPGALRLFDSRPI